MSNLGPPTDDNLITRRKNITKGIEEIRAKKADIAKALRDLNVSNEVQPEQNKDFIKQLIEAFDTLSNQENQYLDILKTIVNIHEQATLDIAKDFEEKIKQDEEKLKERKAEAETAALPKRELTEEEKADMCELQEALLELKKVSEAAVAASELNDKLVEKLQLTKKKKNAMMEVRTKKAKDLDEEATRVRSEVMEKINKMSSLKKSTGQQEKELDSLRKQCLQLGLALGSNDEHEVDDEARRAVNDDAQRVPAIPEMDEEVKEKRRQEIRENIAKEVEKKEQVNSLIREKLAAMEARKRRLQQIRKQLVENQKAEESLKASEEAEKAPIAAAEGDEEDEENKEELKEVVKNEEEEEEENGDEPETMGQSLDAILSNAKANLNNLTAMRERLEHIQQNGGADLDEEDIALLNTLDKVVDQEENLKNDIKATVEESFAAVFEARERAHPKTVDSSVVEARLVAIELMVRHNNEILLKQQQQQQQQKTDDEHSRRCLAKLAPGELRALASRLSLLADIKEKKHDTCDFGEDELTADILASLFGKIAPQKEE